MTSGRRIARELAVIVMPQLPKDQEKLERTELDRLVAKAVQILSDYAKQNLQDADALLSKAQDQLREIEIDHPANAEAVENLAAAPLTTAQIKEQIEHISRAIGFVSEALDIPDLALYAANTATEVKCKKCGNLSEVYIERANQTDVHEFLVKLVSTYLAHRADIDEFIKFAKAKWNLERMVSIDRDILRLACAEAFYLHEVPVNVAISEAVELCHRFADDRAAKFINGVLGYLADEAKRFRIKGVFGDRSLESLPGAGQAEDGFGKELEGTEATERL